ncbi:hypothetical protein SBOR_3485 [Sclerotinia borealis F-4128]|uniref:DUF8035 domain-containing protein n=1 Tax=Sclerotinia borealis (strain F-4128) TaxID=1432307 RepID=W9CN99_SCLBF|nr:hypothetical protein SBOR_3485 [Sclerotinia borealis F-4128]
MSFGASPSDIIIVVTFCRELYRKCRSAGGEYDETSREVRGLHTVLKHLKSEVGDEDSPLNKDPSIWGIQLAPIIGDCDFTLKQLDGLLSKYERSFKGDGSGNGGGKISRDRMWYGSDEMDQLGGIRVKLISHKTSLTLFLDNIQLHENGKMAKNLDVQGEHLDIILDKVDHIAARMSQKDGTLMTTYEDDDKEVWKQFRRELISEGFSSTVLQQHKDVLRAYIRQMEQDGLLVEEPPTSRMASPVSPYSERWIDSTHSESYRGQPPSFDSINIGSGDSGAKEMIQREDNIKFTTSMKLERPKPESHLDPYSERQYERQSTHIRRQISPPLTPKISTTDFTEPKSQKDTSGSGSVSDTSSIHRTKSPSNGLIIQTSDLLLLPFPATSQLLSPASPSSYHSPSDEATRSIALRPKRSSLKGSSPRTSGVRFDLPGHQSSPKVTTPVTGISPRPDSSMPTTRLAPDSYGNEIPPDAKWTKVKRSLISPEVLNQDGRRRPDFVAILGILTREEIQDYVSRSHVLREERWRRHHQASIGPQQRSRRERTSRTRRNSSSSDSSSCSSDTTSDSDNDKRRSKRRDQNGKNRKGYNRECRRERGDRRDREERSERRERTDRRERDREPSYTYTPTTAPYPPSISQTQAQPFSTSPHSGPDNTPHPWNIPGSNQPPQGYPPPPLPPQQGYSHPQPPYPVQGQQYSQGSPFSSPQQYPYPPPPHQYLSPQPYPAYSSSPHSPSSPTYFPSSSSPSSSSPSYKPSNPNYNPHRRRPHQSQHSQNRNRDRDRDRNLAYSDSYSHNKSREGGRGGRGVQGKDSKAPTQTTGSRWRDHLTAVGLGGAAVGLLEVLTEAADGF